VKDELETSLHTALASPDPGEDFTARVMARLPDSTVVPLPAARKRSAFSSAWLPGALAAAVVLGLALQQQDRRAESAAALQAKSQLLVALRITGEQLDRTTHRLQESNP
jgi:hypothetical protein